MSAKKKAEERSNKSPIEVIKDFAAAGQAAQAAVEELEDPEQIFVRFRRVVEDYRNGFIKMQKEFHKSNEGQEKKLNPFRQMQEICNEATLYYLDKFDELEGKKAQPNT